MLHFWRFIKGILLKGEASDPADNVEGSIWHNSTDKEIKSYLNSAVRTVVTEDQAQTLTNKTIDIDSTSNTILNLSSNVDHNATTNTHNLTTDIDHDSITNTHNLSTDIDHDSITNTHNLTTDIDHGSITNGHNLTTDIDHNSITNAHNLTTDIDHDSITNTHDLTTDIDHDSITNTHNLTTDIDHTAISNIGSNSHGDIDTHIGSATQHGVTGSIVGTSDTQVLTNKDIDGGTASDTSRMTIPKNTKSNLDGLTRKEATLVYASDEDKLYVDDGSDLKAVGSGAGDADTIHLIECDDIAIGDVDLTGQNASFDGGGTITASSLTLSTTAADLLKGAKQVIKYSPAANGQNDYFGFTKSIPLAFRGRQLGFQFEYKTSSTTLDDDFRFCVKLKDGANAGNIQYFNMEAFSSNNTGATAKYVAFIPYDCTEIEFGWQNTDTTTTVQLYVDNVLVTSNPFISQNLLDEQSYQISQAGNALSNRTGEIQFDLATATINNEGANLISAINDGTVTKFTALRDCHLTITFYANIVTAGSPPAIYKNGAFYNGMSVPYTNGAFAGSVATMKLEAGEYFSARTAAGVSNDANTVRVQFHAQAEKEAVVHSGDLEFENLRLVGGNGFGSSSTAIAKYSTVAKNTTGKLIKYDHSLAATLGTVIEALQPCTVIGNYNIADFASGVGGAGWSLNANSDVTTVFASISPSYKYGQARPNPAYGIDHINSVVIVTMNIGDKLRVHTSKGTHTNASLTVDVTAIPTARTLITPLTQTAYLKDVKSNNVDGGTFTSGAWQTRTLNTVEGDTSIVTLSNGTIGTDGTANRFTLGAGKYNIVVFAPASKVEYHTAKLYNVTDATDEKIGASIRSNGAYASDPSSIIYHSMTLTSPKTFEIRHRCTTTSSTVGFGNSSNFGVIEVYTQVKIEKVK